MSVVENIFTLRSKMLALGIDAYIIPGSDPHMSEYPAAHWKKREFISGFTGSSGTIVIMGEEAGLWTDSRYFIQAEKELQGTGIELFKLGEEDVPNYPDWIAERLNPMSKVAFNGLLFSTNTVRSLTKKFKPYGIHIDSNHSLVEDIWEGRPTIPENAIFFHHQKYAGLSRSEKLEIIREEMRKVDASHYIITALDEVAWASNLRGSDVKFNPVFHAYLIITLDAVHLFLDPHKITASIGKQLSKEDISIHLYEDIEKWIKDMPSEACVILDPTTTNARIFSAIPKQVIKVEKSSIVGKLKSRKNSIEQQGFRNAMTKDGVAMVKFIHWLENNVGKSKVTELSASKQLRKFRSEQENFVGESFTTISGYGEHGAVVHYSVDRFSDIEIGTEQFYLVDSGGQYIDATTDITRTLHFGKPTEQQKTDYTLVLKGNIALSTASFPLGTRGVHLDVLARKPLWSEGLNYGHGTGHGVGCFLNVHEGPHSIRPQDNGIQLEEGMITSNEPGLYREGEYGIRIENLILTCADQSNTFGDFLKFEVLTLCPIETKAIKQEILTHEEINWLNNYHQMVYKTLSPFLEEELKVWLKDKTKSIGS